MPDSRILLAVAVAAGVSVPCLLPAQDPKVHTFTKTRLAEDFTCEGANFGDLDRDGKNDLVAGPWWWRGPEFKERRAIYPAKPFDPKGYSDNFFAWVRDMDGDGWNDVFSVGFPGKEACWFRNPGNKEVEWTRHAVLAVVDNESPWFTDLAGDAAPELVCQQGGRMGWAAPEGDPAKAWTFHPLSEAGIGGAFTHGLGVGDVNGDGRNDVLWKGGWWEQPASLAGDPVWAHHPEVFGEQGGAQMYVTDVDGDGDADVISSLNAHAFGLAWFEQVKKDGAIAFVRHRFVGEIPEDNDYGVVIGNLHALAHVDMDGDGLQDIVTGNRWWAHSGRDTADQRPAFLHWFRLTRGPAGVEWVPHEIDGDSGVGTQVVAGDVDGDGLPDVVVGNKKGVFFHRHAAKAASKAEWEAAQPKRRTPAPGTPPVPKDCAGKDPGGGDAAAGVRPRGADGRELNTDFEAGDLRDWIASGKAFQGQPIRGDTVHPRRADSRSRHQGTWWIGTFEPKRSDNGHGTLTSAPFRVTHPYASFLVGGGRGPDQRVEVVDKESGKVIHASRGKDREDMRRVAVDLREHQGREVFLRVVDLNSDGWGHINFDDFRLHATMPEAGAPAEPASPQDQETGYPASEAAQRMTVPPGFRVDVIAAEPDLHQPIAFCIDEKARVWVAEAYTYPIRAPEGKGRDKILVFEDADADGKFEKRTTFAEGLNLVSGLEVGFGGVWVGAAPEFLFIPDRDGDLKPDGPPEVLLDGWGYQDTHETLNTFTWGPDGWLYGCHGVFTHSRVGKPGTPDKERTPLNAAVWRYHPTRHAFEIFAWGTSNPWGLDFDAHGQAFITACVIPHLYHVVPGGRYERQAGAHFDPYVFDDIKTIADHRHYVGNVPHDGNLISASAGGGHAHCGAMIYQGDSFPAEWRGRIFMSNIHGNRINTDVLEPKGSGFVGHHGPDFLVSNDKWFRAINFEYGPDGSVFFIDWYDQQACHRTVPEIWDRTNGRLYRVSYGAPKPRKVDLAALSSQELVELQFHDNEWYARMARRILQERGADADVHAALRRIIDGNHDVALKLRAVWALHVTGGFDANYGGELLKSEAECVRAWAVRLLTEAGPESGPGALRYGMLAGAESSPIVRLEWAAALQRLSAGDRIPLAMALTSRSENRADHNLPHMVWFGIEPAVAFDPGEGLALASQVNISQVQRFIWRRLAADERGLPLLVASAAKSVDGGGLSAMVEEMAASLQSRRSVPMPEAWPALKLRLADSSQVRARDLARTLGIKFGDQTVVPELRKQLAARAEPSERRHQALADLLLVKDPELPVQLQGLLDDPAVRGPALRALGSFDHPGSPEAILGRFATFTAPEQGDAATTLASRPASARAMLLAIKDGKLTKEVLAAAATRRRLTQLKDPETDVLLSEVWGRARASDEGRQAAIDRMTKKFPPHVFEDADARRGRALFVKTCGNCHTLFGTGRHVGPELTGANRGDTAYVLTNILDPSAEVAKEYQVTVVEMADGRLLDGIVTKDEATSLTMHLANETVTLQKEDVAADPDGAGGKAIRLSPVSMMPEDQLLGWSDDDVRDLLAYLRAPGQVPALANKDTKDRFFDGRTLAFWDADPAVWSVENGEIVGRSEAGLKANTFAVSHLWMKDFRLVFQVRLAGDRGNSGVQLRSVPIEGGEMRGCQADVGPGWWGKVYEEQARGLLWDKPGDQHVIKDGWNLYEIVAVGDRVLTALNGKRCADLDDAKIAREGVIGLQVHSGGPTEVRFKDFQLELDPEPVLKTVR